VRAPRALRRRPFVTEWGDEGHRKGWCLYKMGCKGPEATFNCPMVQWNDHTSWPIRAGHGCIACASPRFWDHMSPFYDRLPNVPGFGVEVSPAKWVWAWWAPPWPASPRTASSR
jgi:hydrogenase small subunit